MKISIWQQFSSNHSANFTIIAEFKTETEAFKQYLIVRHALQNIIRWFDKERAGDKTAEAKKLPPHQIEVETWKPFGIELSTGCDWIHRVEDRDLPFILRHFDNYISLIPVGLTWGAAEPIDRVLEKLGGKVYRYGATYQEYGFDCIVKCHVPTDSLAIDIVNHLEKSKRLYVDLDQPIPWLPYFSGRKHPQSIVLYQLEQEMIT